MFPRNAFQEVVAANVRMLRAKRRMLQMELAVAANLPRSTVCRIEKGTLNCHGYSLYCIAQALGVSFDFLVDDVLLKEWPTNDVV